MHAIPRRLVLLTLTLLPFVSFVHRQPAAATNIRHAVWAGRFYEADPAELKRVIDQLTQKAQESQLQMPANKPLRALILPHAGYLYSGWTAAHASLVLSRGQFSKVILLGPNHRIAGLNHAAICSAEAYETPLGRVNIHPDTPKLLLQPDLFQSLPPSRDQEHSLEVVLPFLQSDLGKFEIVPVIVGHTDVSPLSGALNALIDGDTLLVVSSDLSHFLPYSEAVFKDRQTIDEVLRLRPDKLIGAGNRACGSIPILILIDIARRRHWQPILLHYSNSGDTAGDRSRVVGYAAIAFFGDPDMENNNSPRGQFDGAHGRILVKVARRAISERLGVKVVDSPSDSSPPNLNDNCFKLHCGTFVTLKTGGELRGCIGNLSASESVLEGVRHNAINAAFHDPRFSPLTKDELARTEIEISILTEPQPLPYGDSQELIQKLRVNVDGVVIRKGYASATFLPQVWEQLPEPADFLSYLCRKAGLSSDAWKSSKLEVLTYQVQYFEETP